MDLNPYKQKLTHLEQELVQCKCKKQTLTDDLNWFDNNNEVDLLHAYERNNEQQLQIELLEHETSQLLAEINEANEIMESEPSYRWVLHGLKTTLSEKQKEKQEKQNLLRNIEIKKYRSFKRKKVIDDIKGLEQKILLLEEKYRKIYDLYNEAEIYLQPFAGIISDLESKISSIEAEIKKVKTLKEKLATAGNSYERALVHKECEAQFDEGNPKIIIKRKEAELKPLERDLKKTKNRAVSKVKKHTRTIRKVIIDGNNMCYEGNKFVGLSPLLELSNVLLSEYSVIIVFDSTIRTLLQNNDQFIRKQFDDKVALHIVATKQSADEVILDIASGDSFCYILSNDRFVEYPEKEIIKNDRLIRHEIVDSNLFIHDLNINFKYSPN